MFFGEVNLDLVSKYSIFKVGHGFSTSSFPFALLYEDMQSPFRNEHTTGMGLVAGMGLDVMVTDINRRTRRFGSRGEQAIGMTQKTVRRVLRSQCPLKSDIGNLGYLYIVDNHHNVKWQSSKCILLWDIGNFCSSHHSGFLVDCPVVLSGNPELGALNFIYSES